jgi:hypothetical protein
MKKLDFHFKAKDASSTKSFDTSQAGISMIINYTEKSGILPMSVIIFFSASISFFLAEMMCKQLIFCVKAATRLTEDNA